MSSSRSRRQLGIGSTNNSSNHHSNQRRINNSPGLGRDDRSDSEEDQLNYNKSSAVGSRTSSKAHHPARVGRVTSTSSASARKVNSSRSRTHPEDEAEVSDSQSSSISSTASSSSSTSSLHHPSRHRRRSELVEETQTAEFDPVKSSDDSDGDSTDPLIDRELLNYMVNIRKRHLKVQKEYDAKTTKVAKLRHNKFFLDHPGYNRPQLEISHPPSKFKAGSRHSANNRSTRSGSHRSELNHQSSTVARTGGVPKRTSHLSGQSLAHNYAAVQNTSYHQTLAKPAPPSAGSFRSSATYHQTPPQKPHTAQQPHHRSVNPGAYHQYHHDTAESMSPSQDHLLRYRGGGRMGLMEVVPSPTVPPYHHQHYQRAQSSHAGTAHNRSSNSRIGVEKLPSGYPQTIDPVHNYMEPLEPVTDNIGDDSNTGRPGASLIEKIWIEGVKSIPFAYKMVIQSTKSRQGLAVKVATLCQREVEKAAYRRSKPVRDLEARSKRALREMLAYWKRNEREERESRKRAEREELEKRKLEEEVREAKRQERKLNFLLTQTELYGHFVSKRLNINSNNENEGDEEVGEDTNIIDSNKTTIEDNEENIDGEVVGLVEADFDLEDEANLKKKARLGAQLALQAQNDKTKEFDDQVRKLRQEAEADQDNDVDQMNFQEPSTLQTDSNIQQPKMLTCQLKSYQLKGLNWLANLYEQGINGILADEMGLGKTVQSISLLAHLAEVHNIWGPFLVIAPASTLHNWHQELTRFAPSLKTIPYWGPSKDRKVLRTYWSKNALYTKDAPFHVLITSYNLIITDEQYFQRIRWQYMVLDEAQAIKSSASSRWRTLLKFHCRNRLLLTGTPIQNSMQELWALLHFIMPSLFDSHEEFSEWFSRDIENHAENSGVLDQHQLSRLHMILKPFMLRRVKKNVQHELGDKIELEVMCQLTPRQKQLYSGLRERISLSELLAKSRSSSSTNNSNPNSISSYGPLSLIDNSNSGNSVDSLLNLVIQFRKVCNHPELFERAEVRSPLAFCSFPESPMVNNFNLVPYNPKSFIPFKLPKLLVKHHIDQSGLPFYDDELVTKNLKAHGLSMYGSANLVNNHFLRCLTGLSSGELNRVHDLDLVTLVQLTNDSSKSNEIMASPQSLLKSIELFKKEEDLVGSTYLNNLIPLNIIGSYQPKVVAPPILPHISDIGFLTKQHTHHHDNLIRACLLGSSLKTHSLLNFDSAFPHPKGNVDYLDIMVPEAAKLIMNSGKLMALDKLLTQLKAEGHRVLLYSQMTRMIDLMEEYLTYRQHSYLRLDGSSKIADRRDLVEDWQTRPELFVFLLSTRAGGLGINLTAADTVIFYDSDWNPTVDQQAMDRAHRLGQTKQVTVYRLVTKNTIEERILLRAKQKDAIHRVVIAGGDFKLPSGPSSNSNPNSASAANQELKSKEIYSLLMEDDDPIHDTKQQQLPTLEKEDKTIDENSGDKKKASEKELKDKEIDSKTLARRPPTSIADLLGPTEDDNGSLIKRDREDNSPDIEIRAKHHRV